MATARQSAPRPASAFVPRLRDFGPFRPLEPFSEADRALFFGRDREVAELAEMLRGEHQSALLLGESGVGKTSLVRAGLMPHLKARGVACSYVEGSALDGAQAPAAGTGGALLIVDDLGAALDGGPRLEQLLGLLQHAGTVAGIVILFVIDDADLYRLEGLERRVGRIGPAGARLHLERFDEARVAEAIERTVLGGGAYFEAGLSQEIAVDLARKGLVSPSELQLVAGTAVNLRISSAKAWRRAGGAEVLTWRFFDKACHAAGGRAAARALAEIAALDGGGVATLEEVARAADVRESDARKLVDDLRVERLVQVAPADHGTAFVLASEWVRPLVRAYTGEARGRGVAARLLMRAKLEGGGLLSLGQVREVRRYAGTLDVAEQSLVSRSLRVGWIVLGAFVVAFTGALGWLYASYGRSSFFDVTGPDPGASVVLRLGYPNMALGFLPHHPRFGAVVIDSGFTRAALKDGLPAGTLRRDGDEWLHRLTATLRPLPRAVMALIVDNDVKPLAEAYEDLSLRPAVVEALGGAGRGGADERALLQKALADPSEDVRRRAVQAAAAIERRSPGGGAPLLLTALKDGSASVRTLALAELQKLPDEQAASLLTTALAQTSDTALRHSALEAIGNQVTRTAQAATALARAMLGPARAEAVGILGRLLDGTGAAADAAEAAVTEIALDAKAPDEARVEALRLLRKRPKTPASLAGLQGSNRVVAMAMPLQARAKPEEAQAKALEAMKGPAPLRAAAAATIGLLPRTADTPKWLKVLEYDASPDVRAEAVRALPVLGREALPLLLKEAKGGGAEVERAAVETLGAQANKLGVSAAATALEAATKGGRASTRRAAVEALGRLAEARPAAAAGVLGRLMHDKAPEIRGEAASALGDVLAHGGKEAIAALKAAGRDPDAAARRRAASALGRAAKTPLAGAAAKALAAFTTDADPSVRAESAATLGSLGAGARDSLGLIAQLVADHDPGVRAAARRAARDLGPLAGDLDRVLLASFANGGSAERIDIAVTAGQVGAAGAVRAGLADADAAVRRAAAEYAGGAGAAQLAALVGALGDRDPAVRVAAVRGLVGAKAATALAQAARSPDLEVRTAALEALGEVGGAVALETLQAALGDGSERVRVAATRGLGHGGTAALALLERALGDGARDVREAAVAGLGASWASQPMEALVARLRDEADADRRFAAALALARQGEGAQRAPVQQALDRVAAEGAPAARLTARVARAFIGRAAAMETFLRILRDGA